MFKLFFLKNKNRQVCFIKYFIYICTRNQNITQYENMGNSGFRS